MMMVILMTSLFMKGTFWNLCMAMPLLYVINDALYDYYAESLTQNDCTHGDVRLVGTPLTSQGVVEICINSHWGRVYAEMAGIIMMLRSFAISLVLDEMVIIYTHANKIIFLLLWQVHLHYGKYQW